MSWLVLFFLGVSYATTPSVDVNQAVNQAKLFSKKGWHDEALQELQEIVETEAGRSSFDVHALMAQVYFELQQADKAKQMAHLAADLALTPGESNAMQQLRTYIDRTFGQVIVEGPYGGMSAPLEIVRVSALLDPALKTWLDHLQDRVSKRAVLPNSLSLPAGEYRINGIPVEVISSQAQTLKLPMSAMSEYGLAALQVSRLEFAMGPAMIFSSRLENLKPSVDFQLGVLQPAGNWIVGVQASWSLRSYSMVGARTFRNPSTFMMGATLGREWILGPLTVRPALGYRLGLLPGVALACNQIIGKSPTQYYCIDPDEKAEPTEVEAYIYAVGRAHLPLVEIAVETQHAGETKAIGLGLKISLEPVVGSIPSPGIANLGDQQPALEYVTDQSGFLGFNSRVLAQTVFAF